MEMASSSSKMFSNLCRLCLGTKDLLCVFDDKVAEDMIQIIHVTSGVLISPSDPVSQMVCSTCCQLTIKMYKFRATSMRNDKNLKARYADYNIAQLTATVLKKEATTVTPAPTPSKTCQTVHPSVQEVMNKYPNITLPNSCLTTHIGAYITLLTDEVKEWYLGQGYSDKDFEKIIKDATVSDEKMTPIEEKKDNNTKKSIPKKRKISLEKINTSANSSKKAKNNISESVEHKVKTVCDKGLKVIIEKISTDDTTKSINKELIEKNTKKSESDNVSSLESNKMKEKTVNKVSFKNLTTKEGQSKKMKESTTNKNTQGDKTAKQDSGRITDNVSNTIEEVVASMCTEEVEKRSETTPTNKQNQNDTEQLPSDNNTSSNESTITLRSLLETSKPIDSIPIDDDDDLEIQIVCDKDTTASKSNKDISNQVQKPKRKDHDLDFFSSHFYGKPPRENDSSDSDPITIDLDSHDSNSTNESERDKIALIEALNLTPKPPVENMPDLSLVSLAPKSHKLFTCKVCDSQHSTLKDMKQHERRTHTKCPFCNKRFRTLANRDEHVNTTCSINKSPVQLKNVRVNLVKVDTVPEIRKKYASAFEEPREEESEKSPTKQQEENQIADVPPTPKECDATTTDAINELEQFLNFAEIIPDQTETVNNADVICISDDENEDTEVTDRDSNVRKLNIINREILNNINIHDNDEYILQKILTKNQEKPSDFNGPIWDGATNRVKIFKDLRTQLKKYKILVDIQYSPVLAVQYQPRKLRKSNNSRNLWYNLKPKELQLVNVQPSPITYSPLMLSTNSTNTSVPNFLTPMPKPVPSGPRSVLKHSASNPLVFTTSSTTSNCSFIPTIALVSTNGFTSTKQVMVPTQNYRVVQSTSSARPMVSAASSNAVVVSSQSHKVTQSKASTSSVMSAPLIVSTGIKTSSNAVILVTTKMSALPVIDSVSGPSLQEKTLDRNVAQLATITESLMPGSATTSEPATSTSGGNAPNGNCVVTSAGDRPMIRVKNLKDLS